MKVIITNKAEVAYIKELIIKDITKLEDKLSRRRKILSSIYFDEELDGF